MPSNSQPDFIIFGSPLVEEAEIAEVVATLRSGWLGTGPRVAEFERRFAEYVGAKHACAVSSCTAALHLSLLAAGIGPGDEVVTTPVTFAATANAIVHVGAKPVFADVDRTSMNISPAAIEQSLTERTRAIIPVHLAGRPCDMDPILEIAARHNLYVIEDAAHAIEAQYHGRHIGTIGQTGCFSFYPTKNVTTGEGGMLTTANDEWAEKIRILSLHGQSRDAWKRFSSTPCKSYEVLYPGYKYNMMDIQAALGLHQLARIEENLRRREEIWRRYDEAFADLPITLPAPAERDTRHARHLYTLLVDKQVSGVSRDDFRVRLHELGVGTGVHYRVLTQEPYYRENHPSRRPLPNAEYISERTVSIPLSPKLNDGEVERIIRAVRSTLGQSPAA
jgi:dTDP-4-amino-4,6-dideoxygalactose transaminase